jgi:M6 family metalloprotease-like protein
MPPPPPIDTTPPVIALTGEDPQIITAGDTYTELGATASDNVDGDVSGSIAIDASAVNTTTAGDYTVTYDVSDSSGNTATTVTRVVRVLLTSPDFVHAATPHVMIKNAFALPSQLDQYRSLEFQTGQAPLMVILLEFPDSPHNPAHPPAYFDDLIFGAEPSVNGYFEEVSYGNFSYENVGITDWVSAPQPASYYFDANQVDSQYTTLAAVSVQSAIDSGVDFDRFDLNADGKVTSDELQILMIMADHPSRPLPNVMATRTNQQVAQGVTTGSGIEVDTWAVRVEENTAQDDRRVYISFYSHELAHLSLNLIDLYNDTFGEDPAGLFSLMTVSFTTYTPHVSPWAKMHLGWITPTVVEGCGDYLINSTETTPEALILHSPSHGTDEYFIIENRDPAGSAYSDPAVSQDRGLAVWHITEFYDDESPGSLGSLPYTALWDCSEASSCYDLTDSSLPRNSRWQDSSLSGIEILDISNAGPVMTVTINRTSGCTN